MKLYLSLLVEFSRRWCTLNDGTFSYYESDKNSNPNGALKASEIVCLAVDAPEKHGYTCTNSFISLFLSCFLYRSLSHFLLTSFSNPQVWTHFWTLLRVRASLFVWHWWTRQPQGLGQIYCQGNHHIHIGIWRNKHKFLPLSLQVHTYRGKIWFGELW